MYGRLRIISRKIDEELPRSRHSRPCFSLDLFCGGDFRIPARIENDDAFLSKKLKGVLQGFRIDSFKVGQVTLGVQSFTQKLSHILCLLENGWLQQLTHAEPFRGQTWLLLPARN